jgi:hypothetical protein
MACPVDADARRQQIGPEFRAVQVAHVLVVRVEHHAIARPDEIGGAGQKAAASAGVASQRGDGQLGFTAQNSLGQIVDGVDVGPGFVSRAFRRLDGVQMHAVRPEIAATAQDDDPGRPRRRPLKASVSRRHWPVLIAPL